MLPQAPQRTGTDAFVHVVLGVNLEPPDSWQALLNLPHVGGSQTDARIDGEHGGKITRFHGRSSYVSGGSRLG